MENNGLLELYQRDRVERALRIFEAMYGKMAAEMNPQMLIHMLEGLSEPEKQKSSSRFKRTP